MRNKEHTYSLIWGPSWFIWVSILSNGCLVPYGFVAPITLAGFRMFHSFTICDELVVVIVAPKVGPGQTFGVTEAQWIHTNTHRTSMASLFSYAYSTTPGNLKCLKLNACAGSFVPVWPLLLVGEGWVHALLSASARSGLTVNMPYCGSMVCWDHFGDPKTAQNQRKTNDKC